MIDPKHSDLSLVRQCQLVSIARSSYYYKCKGESEFNLALMRRINCAICCQLRSELTLVPPNLDTTQLEAAIAGVAPRLSGAGKLASVEVG